MTLLRSSLIFVVSTLVALPALTHGTTQPKHGGIVAMSGETLFELVATPSGVQLYVIDDDEPVNAAKMIARLTTDIGGKVQNIVLNPAAGNRFDGPKLMLRSGAKVAVMVIDKTSQAHMGGTFVIK